MTSRTHPAVRALRGGALAGLVALLAACGPPPFVVNVTFVGEVRIERGAPVVYEGLKVGEVERIALRQDDPEHPAQVELRLAITDPEVKLRTADRFHLSSLRGVNVVAVEPAMRASPPLPDGATVRGVPPVLTRLEAEIDHAIDGIGKATLDIIEEALGSIARGEEAPATRSPADDAARPDPSTPR